MRKLTIISVAAIALAGLAIGAAAETDLEVTGQVRYRSEVDAKSFMPTHGTQNFQILRTRIGLKALVNDQVHTFLQFQDSRKLGGMNSAGQWSSGTLSDSKNVDMHQAYIQIDRLWFDGVGARLGRFEFNAGNQRVFGAVGWSNVGRSWDGVQLWRQCPDRRMTAFWLRSQEENDLGFNRDYDIGGLHLNLERFNLEVFGVYELDDDTVSGVSVSRNRLDRVTLGTYYHHSCKQFDLAMNGAYQFGNWVDTLDIAAYMFTAELGYSLADFHGARLALGIDYASGDSDPGDTKYKAYNNLYYTGHKFRGYMDYFVASSDAGLVDMMFRAKINPFEKWVAKLDAHLFTTAQEYLYPASPNQRISANDGALEFDFSLATTSIAGVNLVGGLSVFLPQEEFVRKTIYDAAWSKRVDLWGDLTWDDDNDSGTPEVTDTNAYQRKTRAYADERANDDATYWGYLQAVVNF